MYKYKHQKLSLKEIFKDAEEEKRNGVRIEYIWVNKCHVCSNSITVLDGEYSFEYKNEKEPVTEKELLEALKCFQKDYSIYEGMYEEEVHPFEYIKLDESTNSEVYYHYVEDSAQNTEYCEICKKVF